MEIPSVTMIPGDSNVTSSDHTNIRNNFYENNVQIYGMHVETRDSGSLLFFLG